MALSFSLCSLSRLSPLSSLSTSSAGRFSSRYQDTRQEIERIRYHEVFAWGQNDRGQCGLGIPSDRILSPTMIEPLSNKHRFIHAKVGWTTSFLVTEKNEVFSWGYGPMGCLAHPGRGDGPLTPDECLPLRGAGVTQVACGRLHTVFLSKDRLVITIGNSEFGQLGVGRFGEHAHSRLPERVDGLSKKNVVSISSGLDHCAALTESGKVWSWGFNGDGQLGLGVEEDADYPTEVKALTDYRILRVQCGLDYTAYLTTEGQLFVTGCNEMGQLGLGDKESVTIPHIVGGQLEGKRVVDIACGGSHMLVLCDSGEVFAWGSGGDGRLGQLHSDDCLSPTRVDALSDKGITRLFAGGGHSFAVNDKEGSLWTWGFGLCGRLGLGSGESVYEPTLMTNFDLKDRVILWISAGVDHNLMVTQKTA